MLDYKTFFADLTVLGQVLLLVLLILYVGKGRVWPALYAWVRQWALNGVFVVSVFATLGSLGFSDILKWEPCKLCWYQRILMYPQALISGMAIFKKDRNVFDYILMFSVIGLVIAGYHYYIQMVPSQTCTIDAAVDCSFAPTKTFGYITIPLMAATAFALNILLSLFGKMNKQSK